jgi:tetratricopeptide (TPR) repeat protein
MTRLKIVFYGGMWLLFAMISGAAGANENSHKVVDKWEASRSEALEAAKKHQYPQAESAFQRLVKQAETSKVGSPRLVLALNDLASVYASEKKFAEARTAYERVLKINEQKYGRESPMLITLLNDVIKVTCVTGECYDTIPELRRLLFIRRKAGGTHLREVPVTLLLLGEAYEKHGDFSQALTYFTEAVATEKKLSGEQSAMAAALSKNVERAKKEQVQKEQAKKEQAKKEQAKREQAKREQAKKQSAKKEPAKKESATQQQADKQHKEL